MHYHSTLQYHFLEILSSITTADKRVGKIFALENQPCVAYRFVIYLGVTHHNFVFSNFSVGCKGRLVKEW